MNKTTRAPAINSAQHPKAAATTALEYFQQLNQSNFNSFGGFGAIKFATPTPEEIAAAAEASEAALIEKLTGKITEQLDSKYKKQLDGMSAQLRKLEETKGKEVGGKSDDDEAKATRQSKADKEISDRLKFLEDERIEASNERVKAAIETHATKFGIDPDAMEDFKAYLERTYPKKFAFDKASKSVVFQQSEYESKGFSEWFAESAKDGKFNRYKAAKTTPQKGPNAGGSAGKSADGFTQMTSSEFKQRMVSRDLPALKPEELTKIKIVD